MWTTDVGRADAGNYTLLKIIFEVNLKLFSKKPRKKVLFVLRDFSEQKGDDVTIKQDLSNDIKEIWKQIHKPEDLKHKVPEDFFDFEFLLMHDKIEKEEKFNEEVTKLRKRFDRRVSNSLFLPDSHSKDIPIDGLPAFIRQVWATI
jgi:hypothetical protein